MYGFKIASYEMGEYSHELHFKTFKELMTHVKPFIEQGYELEIFCVKKEQSPTKENNAR